MAGPNLELFKFGFYVFVPIAMMAHYGNPDWYYENVLPYRSKFWPADAKTTRQFPHDSTELKQELERIKLERRQAREALFEQQNTVKLETSSQPDRLV